MRDKIYISGAISGNTGESHEEKLANFYCAAAYMQSQGFETLNPLDVPACNPGTDHTWDCYLRHDLVAMIEQCDKIAMLPDWVYSKGARLEYEVAEKLGFVIYAINVGNLIVGKLLLEEEHE